MKFNYITHEEELPYEIECMLESIHDKPEEYYMDNIEQENS